MTKIKNENPTVIHMAGHWDSPNRNKIHEWAIAQIKKSQLDFEKNKDFLNSEPVLEINPNGKKIENLTIVIFSNYKKEKITQQRLNQLGLSYFIVGGDVKKFSFKYKFSYIKDYVLPKIETKYLLFLDAGDVFVTDKIFDIVKDFELNFSKTKILFNAEAGRWPLKTNEKFFMFEEKNNQSKSLWCYLNSGVYIADKEYLKNHLDELLSFKCNRTKIPNFYKNLKNMITYIKRGNYDDQEASHALYFNHYPVVDIDFEQMLFVVSTNINKDGFYQRSE